MSLAQICLDFHVQVAQSGMSELYYVLEECKGHPRAASSWRRPELLRVNTHRLREGPEHLLPLNTSEVRSVPYYVSLVLKAHFPPYILKSVKFQHALHLVESYSYSYQRFSFPLVIAHKVMNDMPYNQWYFRLDNI